MTRHLSRSRRRAERWLLTLSVAAAAALTSSCSSSPTPSPTRTPRHTAGPSASASLVSGDPGDPTLLPVPADLPFSQASIALQDEWRRYFGIGAITVIPNTTVPYKRPPTPQVANATNGAIDDATAQRWGDDLMRETAWENWAITTDQTSLLDSGVISAPAVTAGISLPQGATGFTIAGSRWPSSLRLVRVSSDAQAFLHISDQYALIVSFAQGWSVEATFPDGHVQPLTAQVVPAHGVAAITGKSMDVQDFGELWFGSDGFACDSGQPPTVQSLCAE